MYKANPKGILYVQYWRQTEWSPNKHSLYNPAIALKQFINFLIQNVLCPTILAQTSAIQTIKQLNNYYN